MVNVTGEFTGTLLVLFAGFVETTLNELTPYVALLVVNVLVLVVTVFPCTSLNPLTDTLKVVALTSRLAGVKVRVTPSLARLTVPANALAPEGVTVIELLVMLVGSMGPLINTVTSVLSGTLAWPLAGLIELTFVPDATVLAPVVKKLV
jgi:hypothetical protein